jgi:DNA-binding transcriptional LysR family regulator
MDFDWTLLKSFAAVGEHGSLSAAARATGASQPTLSRHVSQLEQQVGSRLFERDVGGVALTARGIELMHHVQEMVDAAARLSMAIDRKTETFSGSVRITASDIVATYVLPDILTALRIAEPDIDLELVASDETENLLRREADIAVRMYRPTQTDVIARKVGDLAMGMFASKSYVKRRGMPQHFGDILDHDVIGYDRSTQIIDGFRQAGSEVKRDFFAFRCDNQVVCWQMVRAGFGIGFNQIQLGEADPNLVRIDSAGEVGNLPIWLTAHLELRTSPRIRRVFDFLAEQLSASTR